MGFLLRYQNSHAGWNTSTNANSYLKIVNIKSILDLLDNTNSIATSSDQGLMSATDKSNLDGIINGTVTVPNANHANYTETLHSPGVAWISARHDGYGPRLYQMDNPNGNAVADNIRVSYASSTSYADNAGYAGSSGYASSANVARHLEHYEQDGPVLYAPYESTSVQRIYSNSGRGVKVNYADYADNAGYASSAYVATVTRYSNGLMTAADKKKLDFLEDLSTPGSGRSVWTNSTLSAGWYEVVCTGGGGGGGSGTKGMFVYAGEAGFNGDFVSCVFFVSKSCSYQTWIGGGGRGGDESGGDSGSIGTSWPGASGHTSGGHGGENYNSGAGGSGGGSSAFYIAALNIFITAAGGNGGRGCNTSNQLVAAGGIGGNSGNSYGYEPDGSLTYVNYGGAAGGAAGSSSDGGYGSTGSVIIYRCV
jgi:hypothetical protein